MQSTTELSDRLNKHVTALYLGSIHLSGELIPGETGPCPDANAPQLPRMTKGAFHDPTITYAPEISADQEDPEQPYFWASGLVNAVWRTDLLELPAVVDEAISYAVAWATDCRMTVKSFKRHELGLIDFELTSHNGELTRPYGFYYWPGVVPGQVHWCIRRLYRYQQSLTIRNSAQEAATVVSRGSFTTHRENESLSDTWTRLLATALMRALTDAYIDINQARHTPGTSTRIIAGWPGVGKSHLGQSQRVQDTGLIESILDLDSTPFTARERNSVAQYSPLTRQKCQRSYAAYADTVTYMAARSIYKAVLCSTHRESLEHILGTHGEHVTIVLPQRRLKDEYEQRYIERGSPQAMINAVIGNWDQFQDDVEQLADLYPNQVRLVVLGPGQYLSDYMDQVLEQ